MRLRNARIIFLKQLFLLKRSYIRLLSLFYWSSLDLIMWGVLTVYLSRGDLDGAGFVGTILGSIILFNFFVRINHGISVSFMEDVWARAFVNLFASPLSIHEYLLGLTMTSIMEAILAIGFVSALAAVLFAFNIFTQGIMLVPFVGILFLFGIAVGIFSTSTVLRLGPSAEMIVWSLPAVLSPLSAVFYPVEALPSWAQSVSAILPSTHVFEGMRTLLLSGEFNSANFMYGLFLAILYLCGSYAFLLFCYRVVLRKGLFARFVTQ